MIKRLHGTTLRMLPGPILGWLGMLMFLLLMQFLIKYLPEIAGKGLPPLVVVELIAYNLAYMLVLAVPMSILIGAMMVFGKISESRAYVVIKSAGISPIRLIWPVLAIGVLLTGAMIHFNNVVLPEANFRARNLWQDIRQKRPGFQLQEGVFYEGLNRYSILVQKISRNTEELENVLIYDYTRDSRAQTVVKARHGRIQSLDDRPQLRLTLHDGEVHRLLANRSRGVDERYERLVFDRYQMYLDISDFDFERSDPEEGYRSDRTMRTGHMVRLVDSLNASIAASREKLRAHGLRIMRGRTIPTDVPPTLPISYSGNHSSSASRVALEGVDSTQVRPIINAALTHARTTRGLIDDTIRSIEWETRRADRFRVEIHKKYSIAIACFIFMLIGAPLGLSIRRGGLGMAGILATGIFLFYWVTLVQGEKLADRGFLEPWIGMWAANIVMLVLGLWLMVFVTLDLRATPPLRRRLLRLLSKRTGA